MLPALMTHGISTSSTADKKYTEGNQTQMAKGMWTVAAN